MLSNRIILLNKAKQLLRQRITSISTDESTEQLSALLKEKLSLSSEKENVAYQNFQKELAKTPFSIFTCVKNVGYVQWKPIGKCRKLSNETVSSVQQQIHFDRVEPPTLHMENVPLPHPFETPSDEHHRKYQYQAKYPFSENEVAHFVALEHFCPCSNQSSHHQIRFLLGGSTLELLATQKSQKPYYATHMDGKILIAKSAGYTGDPMAIGFQFERLLTCSPGNGNTDPNAPANLRDRSFIEHLHILQIGRHMAICCAETDAIDIHGNRVELKASPPQAWGTKVMFQMISSASALLVSADKSKQNVLKAIHKLSLSKVVDRALAKRNVHQLEQNILEGLEALDLQLGHRKEGDVYLVAFRNGKLELAERPTTKVALLPPLAVVRGLIKEKK